jgi:rubrerythrin
MAKTVENLKAAFAGESQANRKYLAFAKKADEEGHAQVARLFRAVAEAETIHAHSHFQVMEGVQTTAENLKAAIGGENYEVNTMYPAFLSEAQEEGEKKASRSFALALEVEKVHEKLYTEALENLGKETGSYDYYVCAVCGSTHAGSAPDKCPVCGAGKDRFLLIH